jgi:hypothetical protein
MGLITVVCPRCREMSQLDDSLSAMCPYCGTELGSLTGHSAPDLQFAQAPPPVQPVSLVKPAAGTFSQAEQHAAQPQQQPQGTFAQNEQVFTAAEQSKLPAAAYIDPQTLAEAKSKRRRWVYLTLLIAFIQALPVFLYALADDYSPVLARINSVFSDDLLVALWLLFMPVGAAAATGLRPDNAYIEKKPLIKNKFVLFILLGILLGFCTTVWGAMSGTFIADILIELGLV